jgi:hypothetical protein
MSLGAAPRFCRLVALLAVAGSTVTSNALANTSVPRPWRVHSTIDTRGLLGLSCPSVSLCVAVDGAGNVIESRRPSDAASGWVVARVDDGNQLVAVSCPSVSLCVAVDGAGDVVTSTNPAGGAGAWTVARVDGTNGISSVSCPSSSLCVAVDNAGNAIVSTDPTGRPSTWTVGHIDDQLYYECFHYGTPPCQPKLVGVSCSSVSLCVAADDAGFAISSSQPAATGPWSRNGSSATSGQYVAASCAAESLCVATCPLGVGGNGGCDGDPGASYDSTSVVTWNPTTVGPSWRFASISVNPPAGVWCRSGPLCFASDTTGNLFGSINPAGGATAWSVAHVGTSVVTGLSCPSISSCFAVDGAGNVLAGGPPPTAQQIRALLLEQLVPVGKRAQIATVLKNGGYSFFSTPPSAGQLSISWTLVPRGAHLASKLKTVLIAAAKMRFASGGRVKIKIKLTRRGTRRLAAAQHLRLTAKATFTPRGRPGITALTTFTLRR